jgi:hypothetical protein
MSLTYSTFQGINYGGAVMPERYGIRVQYSSAATTKKHDLVLLLCEGSGGVGITSDQLDLLNFLATGTLAEVNARLLAAFKQGTSTTSVLS